MTRIEHAQRRLKLINERESQIATIKRLRQEARAMLAEIEEIEARHRAIMESKTLTLRECEAETIRHALELAKGRITIAAPMLGTSYQALAYVINNRHPSLIPLRTPINHRRPRT